MIHVDRLDHLVLTVANVEATLAFYARVLGMEAVTFAGGRRGLAFGRQKVNLHQAGQEFEPKAQRALPGTGDFCFILGDGVSLRAAAEHLQACGVPLVQGPVPKVGALGPMQSLYFRDPDGNLVEVSVYDAP